jgi:hypothetical protein
MWLRERRRGSAEGSGPLKLARLTGRWEIGWVEISRGRGSPLLALLVLPSLLFDVLLLCRRMEGVPL